VTVWPATVRVPVRTPVVVFGATVYCTCPIPLPVANVTVIQSTLLTAVHRQLWPVITDRALVLPFDGTETIVGVTVAVHCASTGATPAAKMSAPRAHKRRSVIAMPPVRAWFGPMELTARSVHIPRLPM
jgi:hypothetical protein